MLLSLYDGHPLQEDYAIDGALDGTCIPQESVLKKTMIYLFINVNHNVPN
jgi:hypothetical protein